MPQISPQRRAQQFSCRGSRKRLLRWSAATYQTLEVSARRRLCVGEVVYLHARAGIVRSRPHVRELDAYKPVARLFANLYAPLGKPFTLVRQTYAEWFASNGVKRG